MTREIQPHQTPSRRAWLETLERGPARRGKSATGFHCMRLGWTRWVDIANSDLEELTDAGRAALAEWRAAQQKGGEA